MPKLIANLSKKVPIPGVDYASQQASITLEADVGTDTDLQEVARHLYTQAESAVDRQLGIAAVASASSTSDRRLWTNHPAAQHRHANGNGNGHPHRHGRNGRAAPQATESQLKFLRQLLGRRGTDAARILQEFEITRLEELTIPQASELIDDLKKAGNGKATR